MVADVVAVLVPAPSDLTELYREYYPYVCRLLVSEGIPSQDIEDAASDIFARFIKLDVIGQFDPGHHIEHGGQVIAPNFRTFLSRKVRLYARGQRDKVSRRVNRELLLCDQQVEGGSLWVEIFGGQVWDDYSRLGADEFVTRMRSYLATLPPRSDRDRCDLLALFDLMVSQVRADGKLNYSVFQQQFGISGTSVGKWVGRLRTVLREVPDDYVPPPPPTFTVGGVELTEPELREAIEILKSRAGGIMVRQPLAGHKLAQAEKGWYHPFSREEIRLYPELKIDPATHKKPAGHVRKAVVHRLERMLGDTRGPGGPVNSAGSIPVASTTPEPDQPEDLFEAALWKLGATAEAVDQIKELAAQVYA